MPFLTRCLFSFLLLTLLYARVGLAQFGLKMDFRPDFADWIQQKVNSTDSAFLKATAEASKGNYMEVFEAQTKELKLARYFVDLENFEQIDFFTTNKAILESLKEEWAADVETSKKVLTKRIRKAGIGQYKLLWDSNHVSISLPGKTNLNKVRNLVSSPGKFELWEIYPQLQTLKYLEELNALLKNQKPASDYPSQQDRERDQGPIFNILDLQGSEVIGRVPTKDSARLNELLDRPIARQFLPDSIRFLWNWKEVLSKETGESLLSLYAIKSKAGQKAPVGGEYIAKCSAKQSKGSKGFVLSVVFDSQGANLWREMSEKNIGSFVALVLDHRIYTASRVHEVINNGQIQIDGNFDEDTAKTIAVLLGSGHLPIRFNMVSESLIPK